MSAAAELLRAVESAGGSLTLDGDRLKCRLPRQAESLVTALRAARDDIIAELQRRSTYLHLCHGGAADFGNGQGPELPAQQAGEVLPNMKFRLLLADPPWRYQAGTIPPKKSIEAHYPTLTLEEIKSFPSDIGLQVAEDAVLFLWATSPLLFQAGEVMRAWGFEYKSSMVWDKQNFGMGHWVRVQHELLLIGAKGNFPPPEDARMRRSLIYGGRREHSRKPEESYRIIEDMYPECRGFRVELFGRYRRAGWFVHGDDVRGESQGAEESAKRQQ